MQYYQDMQAAQVRIPALGNKPIAGLALRGTLSSCLAKPGGEQPTVAKLSSIAHCEYQRRRRQETHAVNLHQALCRFTRLCQRTNGGGSGDR